MFSEDLPSQNRSDSWISLYLQTIPQGLSAPTKVVDRQSHLEIGELAIQFHSIYLSIRNYALNRPTNPEKARILGLCLDELAQVVKRVESAFKKYDFGRTRRISSRRPGRRASPVEKLDYFYWEGEYYIHQSNILYQGTLQIEPSSGIWFGKCLEVIKAEIDSMELFVRPLVR